MQLDQAITADYKQKRKQFCVDMQKKLEEEFYEHLVFNDETIFHMICKVNRHNVRIWGEKISMSLLSMRETHNK